MNMNLQYFGGRGSGGGKGSGGGGGGFTEKSSFSELSTAFDSTKEGSKLQVTLMDGTTKTYTRTREYREDYIDKSEGGPRFERYVADEWGPNMPSDDMARIAYDRLTGRYGTKTWKKIKITN